MARVAAGTVVRAARPAPGTAEQRPALAFITLPAEFLRPTLLHLRDREGFTHLVLLTAVDWIEEGRFQLTYLLSNRTQASDIGLRVMIERPASDERVLAAWKVAGGWMSVMRPQRNRLRRRSSKVGMLSGIRSDEITICLLAPWSELKVWKNSSWSPSFPSMNWMSSMSKTSTSR